MRISTLLSFLPLLASPAPALSEVLSPTGVGHEVFQEAAKISGRAVAGIGFPGPRHGDPPAMTVFIPGDWRGETVCLETISQDGRYVSEWEYVVDGDWTGGFLDLPARTEYPAYLKDQDAAHLAALIRRSACGQRDGGLSAAAWNIGAAPAPDALTVQLNSLRSDEVSLVSPNGDEVTCQPVETGYRIAFDFLCNVPTAILTPPVTHLEILRIRGGRVQPVQGFDLNSGDVPARP